MKGALDMKKKNEKKGSIWIGLLAAVLLCALAWNTFWRQTHTPSEAAPARDTPVPPPVTIMNTDGSAHEDFGNVESPVLPGQDLSGIPTDEGGLPSGYGAADNDLWYLILVNNQHPVPDHYTVDLVEVAGGEQVDVRIYDPLMEMLEDAKEANWGQAPVVVSGYRTFDDQQRIYDDKVKKYRRQGYADTEALELAGQYAALPGCSEHQLGLAVDINGATYDVYLWLQENSYKYGFIFRYPGNKTGLTGIAEEVWHYRYVGPEAAAEIYEQGICLEEYVQN